MLLGYFSLTLGPPELLFPYSDQFINSPPPLWICLFFPEKEAESTIDRGARMGFIRGRFVNRPLVWDDEVGRLSGPVSRDTARLSQRYPPIARYGVFGVSTWPIGCDTHSPSSERFPLGEHAKWRCDAPAPQKGYLSDTCAIPYENKADGCDTPSAILSRKGIARYGGLSRTGPLSREIVDLIFRGFGLCGTFGLSQVMGRDQRLTAGLLAEDGFLGRPDTLQVQSQWGHL